MRTLKELSDLKGRTVLITGGAGHLGQAFGHVLAEMGAGIALADRNKDAAERAAQNISTLHGVPCLGIGLDLACEEELKRLPQQVAAHFGGLDVLINNAGFVGTDKLTGWCVPFEEQSAETWRAATEVNMTAPFFLTQAATPWLRKHKRGSVINIASIYAFLGPDMRLYDGTSMGNPAAYAASKGGLIQSTRWLSTVLAPEIRVNCVSPGGIWRNQPESFVKAYEARTPMRRMGTEEDMTGAIAFLASDLSLYVTGQHIAVDGGWSAW